MTSFVESRVVRFLGRLLAVVLGDPITTPYEKHDNCQDACYLSQATKEILP